MKDPMVLGLIVVLAVVVVVWFWLTVVLPPVA